MLIYHHLGLGDHLICNGLVRHFAESEEVQLLCKDKNLANIQYMYRDNKHVRLISVKDDIEANIICNSYNNSLKVGIAIGGEIYNYMLWDENFYKNANIPFEYSWSKFFYERDETIEESFFKTQVKKNTEYIFIHNIDSYGIDRIDWNIIDSSKQIIITNKSIPFFAYGKIIQYASEIHCIDSSFKHLVERIPTTGTLYYHKTKYHKPFDNHNSKKTWVII